LQLTKYEKPPLRAASSFFTTTFVLPAEAKWRADTRGATSKERDDNSSG
jgi:hypothetical protein